MLAIVHTVQWTPGPALGLSGACNGFKCPDTRCGQWLRCPVVKAAKVWPVIAVSCDHISQCWTHCPLNELSVYSMSPDDQIGQWLKCPVLKLARIWPVVALANGEIVQW